MRTWRVHPRLDFNGDIIKIATVVAFHLSDLAVPSVPADVLVELSVEEDVLTRNECWEEPPVIEPASNK
ncbi:hypothetical protein J7337_006116 [Fusarium musae]|uniref:Uncharacterized protein n=1 Tax=Fusarium musae TaxID=1042133 RepID=A0A9P8IS54_9HYPO|nr:hypothetical protein J7337_006116 [Fusarium musae]KAG9503273.1 hypothetical protein J7337_006116 [Fusarium musae]